MKRILAFLVSLLLLIPVGCAKPPAQTVTDYSYSGKIEAFTVTSTGYYLLEVWGAQGGGCSCKSAQGTQYRYGGKGGYAKGYVKLYEDETLYICVGGKGGDYDENNESAAGGYNGGGYAKKDNFNHVFGAGGGATHIARQSGVLADMRNIASSVLLVAGGGGGARLQSNMEHPQAKFGNGGDGGGETGGIGQIRDEVITADHAEYYTYKGFPGSQSSGAAFGQGGIGDAQAGGGGGWFGGQSGQSTGTGHGGSGHLGAVENGSMESGVNNGYGRARITWVGSSLPKE